MDSRFNAVDDARFDSRFAGLAAAWRLAANLRRLLRALWREVEPTLELMHRTGYRWPIF